MAKPYIIIGIAAAVLLAVFHYIAPIQPASVTVYTGLTLVLAGLVCLIRPVPLLLMPARRRAGLVVLGGLALFVVGLSVPAETCHAGQRASHLDDVMPEYQFYERHETHVNAPPEVAAKALKAVTFDDIAGFKTLMTIRAAASGRSHPGGQGQARVLETLVSPRSSFFLLHEDDREIVMGLAGRPWADHTPAGVRTLETLRAYAEPNAVQVAFNLLIQQDGQNGSRIITETRVRATDDAGRRTMARYWRVIYPGSGMIRRMWLNAARSRAEQPR